MSSKDSTRLLPDRQAVQDCAHDDSGRAAGFQAIGATAMPVRDTASFLAWSRAVSEPSSNRPGDVDSTNARRTAITTPVTRTSRTATRTGTTRTTSSTPASSEESYQPGHAALSFEELYLAYLDCRRRKRTTASALRFELRLGYNLTELHERLIAREWHPGRSICFVAKYPKPREIWAADFPDRIVHHAVYRRIGPLFERSFIVDSCACIKGRGTLYAVERLEHHVRSITENWSKTAFYLKCDLANFFVSINKNRLWGLLAQRIAESWVRELAYRILFDDPRLNYEFRGSREDLELVPRHKRLACQPETHGLPIGNLPSQLGANILLNVLDQHVKHYIGAKHYVRYVDDFVILGRSPQWLNAVLFDIGMFLPAELDLQLNTKKTVLQPIARGIDFVGQVIKPWHRRVRRRVVREGLRRIEGAERDDLHTVANSYFGLCRQATKSRRDRARLARACLHRGHLVNGALTKTYARASHA